MLPTNHTDSDLNNTHELFGPSSESSDSGHENLPSKSVSYNGPKNTVEELEIKNSVEFTREQRPPSGIKRKRKIVISAE